MDSLSQEGEEKKKLTEITEYTLKENQKNYIINKKNPTKPSKEEIINRAFEFHSKGNIQEAAKYYQYIISQGFNDHRVFSNYGIILKFFGKLKEAELCLIKAIELKPNYAVAHSNLGNILKDLGKLKEAEFSYRKAIELNPNYAVAYSNLGNALRDLGKLKEAEFAYRKAIELNPNFAVAHSNLGNALRDLGKLKEAELCLIKAIELNPDFAKAYFSLSSLKYSNNNAIWKSQLFDENFLVKKSKKNQIDIYFARANILHKEKRYDESSRYLQLANKLKLILKPSNAENLINQSKELLIESNKKDNYQEAILNHNQSIFIVGMPRSGSTLLESILSMNTNVDDLGETVILKESFLDYKNSNKILNFSEIYWGKIKFQQEKKNIVTNKNLLNYQFAGIIAKKIPNAKIIHCYRHPLDNILSIFKAHFAKGNEYSSSLVDCAKVYLDQKEVMKEYKNRFRPKIYDLNYDLLVKNPHKEIQSLISWLGWKWEDKYLSPHLNPRSVSTASSVQVRSPINSKSLGGWKNYKDMLKPAIKILTKDDEYKNLRY